METCDDKSTHQSHTDTERDSSECCDSVNNRSRLYTVLSVVAITGATAAPVSQAIFKLPIITHVTNTLSTLVLGGIIADVVTKIFEYIFGFIIGAIFGIMGWFFVQGTQAFLFFKPPGAIPSLANVWLDLWFLFPMGIMLAGLSYFLMMQLFPEQSDADIFRYMERVLAATVLFIVMSPLVKFELPVPGFVNQLIPNAFESADETVILDGFSSIVFVVNVVGEFIMPDGYRLTFLQGSIDSLLAIVAGVGGLLGSIIAVAILGLKFILAILLTIATFYVMLAFRMLLIYVVYALMPMLLGMWLIDVGPLRYANKIASIVFKVTAMLLFLGIIISGVLLTTGTIAGQNTSSSLDFALGETYEENTEISEKSIFVDGENGPEIDDEKVDTNTSGLAEDDGGSDDDEGDDDQAAAAATGIGTQATGVDEPPDGFTRIMLQTFAWIGGIVLSISLTMTMMTMAVSLSTPGQMKTRAMRGQSPTSQSGSVYDTKPATGDQQDGGIGGETEGDSMPDPDSDEVPSGETPDNLENQQIPITEKVGNVARGSFDKAADKIHGEGAGEAIREKTKDTAEDMYGTAADLTPQPLKKMGSLGYRGGKSWYSIAKQPTVAESIGEMGRIARSSPIGNPEKSTKPWFDGASEDDISMEDYDVEDATSSHQQAEGNYTHGGDESTDTGDGGESADTGDGGESADTGDGNNANDSQRENDELEDEIPIKEKLGNVARGSFDKAAKKVHGEGAGESIRERTRDTAEDMYGKAADMTPQPLKKMGSLGYRGGKSLYSIAKQPTVAESIGEMGRIARSSPIGNPEKSTKPWFGGRSEDDASMDDFTDDSRYDPVDLDEVKHDDSEFYDDDNDYHGEFIDLENVDVTSENIEEIDDDLRRQDLTIENENGTEIEATRWLDGDDDTEPLEDGNYDLGGVLVDDFNGDQQLKIGDHTDYERRGDQKWRDKNNN